jgi:hypothetical protein
VYYAAFSDNHPDRYVSVIVSLGEWGEGSQPSDRVAFGLRIRAAKAEYQVMVIDAGATQWGDVDLLGRMLTRKQALKHRWLKEAFHISDHIVMEDQDVKAYLDDNQQKTQAR